MNEIPISTLVCALVVLLLVSAFFSATEIAMMSLNRYRLRHFVRAGHRGAILAQRLLDRPDRLIGVILLCSNFTNAMFSAITTALTFRLLGADETSVAIATVTIAVMVLIFTDLAPKTLAALNPERIAFPTSFLLIVFLKLFYPAVWVINAIANSILKLFGVSLQESPMQQLSREELRTVVHEAGALIPRRHQKMLLSILDLEKATVDDIMIPRSEIVGIDIENDEQEILNQLTHCQHTRLPVYRDDIENVIGFLHARNALRLMTSNQFSKEALRGITREANFVPEGTSLTTQLLNFQREKRRIALVVDEYGDIQGLITLEDILEEIVGEFTTDAAAAIRDIHAQDDGTYLVDGAAYIREINRLMQWELPTDGPKTLNGLIIEYLESIPESGTSVRIAGYPIDIVQTTANAIKTVRIHPALRTKTTTTED